MSTGDPGPIADNPAISTTVPLATVTIPQEPTLVAIVTCLYCKFKARFTYHTPKRKPVYCNVCGRKAEVEDIA